MKALASIWRSESWVLALACFGLRAVSLVRSCLSDDEAIYAVVAREMLAGRGLYRDIVDHKPPLIYLLYAATQALGGARGGMFLLHLLAIGAVLSTALILVHIIRRSSGLPATSRAPFFAGLLYVVFTTTLLPFDALAANCELFMMLPLTASVLFFLHGAADLRWSAAFAAGLLDGTAILLKYQAGVQLLLYLGTLAVLYRPQARRGFLFSAAILAGVATSLGVALALLWHAGCLDAAWFWFRFNFGYIEAGMRPLDTLKRAAIRVSFAVLPAAFLWVLGARAALRSLRPSQGRQDSILPRFATAWLAVSVLAVSAGGRFFGHYFHQITAPLAVLAAPAAAQLWQTRRRLLVAAVSLPTLAFLLVAVFQRPVFAAVGQSDPDYGRMADLIHAHARPGDRLLVWGNLPTLYFTAQMPLGTRFVFSNYMTGLSPATPSQSDPAVDASPNIVPESWDMFEADVTSRKPRLVVDTSPGNLAAYGKFPPSHFPRLQTILDRDYQLTSQIDGLRVYRRRERSD